jgi:uncharacterized protein (TIGR00159 family)
MLQYALRWQTLLDFVVLAVAIYLLLRWSRDARALRVTFGILGLEAGASIAGQLDLAITVWILHAAAVAAGVVLIVLFQPELRHAINRLEIGRLRTGLGASLAQALEAVSTAAFSLAGARRGALLVLTRRDSVNELLPGGVPLGGYVSPEILEAIFRKVSPVHDGATIIERDRITRVGALLPLSQNEKLPRTWGTRHRAAMGLAERSDAVIVVVSEERGEVTLMHDGEFRRIGSADEMLMGLRALIAPEPATRPRHSFRPSELLLPGAAIGLAFVIMAATSLVPGAVVRVRTVPIDVTNLAPGLRILDQSAVAAQVRLRGGSWALDSIESEPLSARVDVQSLPEGIHMIAVGPPRRLPIGVTVEAMSPQRITLRLQLMQNTPANPKGGVRQ